MVCGYMPSKQKFNLIGIGMSKTHVSVSVGGKLYVFELGASFVTWSFGIGINSTPPFNIH